MHRAYALLTVKSLDAEKRQITGVATTPEADRMGDVVEPLGVAFKNPLPLLLFHDTQQPVGFATFKKPTKNGIEFSASLPAIDEPGTLKDRIDTAWQSLKAGLISGVSIGFRAIETSFIEATGGIRFLETEVVELSLVTIPANSSATILTVKALDLQAASGPHLPGVSGLPIVKAKGKMTVQEQITSFEQSRGAKLAEMNAIMTAASGNGSTLDAAQTETYDSLAAEVKSIEDHLPRLRLLEKSNVAAATPVTKVIDTKTASDVRGGGHVVSVKSNLPKGTSFTRLVIAKINGKGSISDTLRYIKGRADWADTPEIATMLEYEGLVQKAAVNPGTVTDPAWAAPLAVVRPLMDEFIELLRARTVIDRIPGLRRVPFNVSVPIQNAASTVAWVGEGAPKPVGQLGFTSTTLLIAKAAGIVAISVELAKISNPSAEALVREDLIREIAKFLDTQFLDPTVAGVTGVSPASITNGAQGIGTAGTSADNARTDIKALVTAFTNNMLPINESVFIMSEANAFALAGAITTLGVRPFPDIMATGGTLLGVPVITSQAAANRVILVHTPSILLADDGGVNVDISQEASLEMNTAPTSPVAAATVLVSLWQQNLIGVRAERFINWKRARTTAVVYTTATYV